jgi:hypothetical protein
MRIEGRLVEGDRFIHCHCSNNYYVIAVIRLNRRGKKETAGPVLLSTWPVALVSFVQLVTIYLIIIFMLSL